MARDFTAHPAARTSVPLLIGLSGPPGAGKTMSALMLATGIKADRGGDIIVLDTDGDRAKYYAPRPGEKADLRTTFEFQHFSFEAPYSPNDFLAAIRHQLPSKPSCIIVDTMSSEHEDEGGVLEWHDRELDRMAGNDWDKRERVGQAAWKAPKAARRGLINAILKIKTPIIFCFRAREKVKQIRNDKGKMAPTNIGWTPIAPAEIVGSMTLFCPLPIKSDGVPMWKGNTAYEDFSIKLPEQFRGFLQEGKPITAETGRAMSEWARGAVPTGFVHDAGTTKPQEMRPSEPMIDLPALRKTAEIYADRGDTALTDYLGTLNKAQKDALRPFGTELRARAQAVGQKPATDAGTQDGGQSDKPVAYQLSKTPDNTLSFENESDYLWAYEEIVELMHSAGNTAGLAKFDERNAVLIAQHEGLGLAVNVIDRKVRV
jgi:hypothetical protein